MVFAPDLLDAIERAPVRRLETVVWRHTFGSNPPEQANTGGARWNPPGVDALYASLERRVAIAEGDYRLSLEPLRPSVRRSLHQVSLRLESVIDLSTPETLASVGLAEQDIADLPIGRSQEVGGAVEWLQHDGLLVPSARANGLNIVVFPTQMQSSGRFEVITTEIIFEPPPRK